MAKSLPFSYSSPSQVDTRLKIGALEMVNSPRLYRLMETDVVEFMMKLCSGVNMVKKPVCPPVFLQRRL